jgi:hypothetical protein
LAATPGAARPARTTERFEALAYALHCGVVIRPRRRSPALAPMPNPLTSTARRRMSQQGSNGTAGHDRAASHATCERDDTYGLISVVYHALQGAETCAQYVEDARRSNNLALEAFFEEARIAQNDLAFKGKHLLAAQLEATLDEDLGEDVYGDDTTLGEEK